MATPTVEKLLAATREQAQQAQTAYLDLVRSAAAGADIPPKTALGVLRDAGKTTEDLARDVAAVTRRIELRAKLDSEAKLVQEREHVVKKVEAAKAKLAKAEEAFDAECRPLEYRIKSIDAAIAEAHDARRELTSNAPPDRTARLAEVRTAVEAAQKRVTDLEEKIARNKTWLTQPPTTATDDYSRTIEGAKTALAAYEPELIAARAEVARLVSEMEAASAGVLDP